MKPLTTLLTGLALTACTAGAEIGRNDFDAMPDQSEATPEMPAAAPISTEQMKTTSTVELPGAEAPATDPSTRTPPVLPMEPAAGGATSDPPVEPPKDPPPPLNPPVVIPKRECQNPAQIDPVPSVPSPLKLAMGDAGANEEMPVLPDDMRQDNATVWADFDLNNMGAWTSFDGTWAITDGAYNVTMAPALSVFTTGTTNIEEWPKFCSVVVVADMRITSAVNGHNAGLVFSVSHAFQGNDNYAGYYVGLRPEQNRAELGRADKGQWRELAAAPFDNDLGQWYRLKVVAADHDGAVDIQLLVDGEPVLSHTDPTPLLPGTAGVRSYQADTEWDNFSVHRTSEAK